MLVLASTSRTPSAQHTVKSPQTTESLSNFTDTSSSTPTIIHGVVSLPSSIHTSDPPILDTPKSQPVTLNKPPQKPLPPHHKPSSPTNPSPPPLPTTSPPTPPATTKHPPPPNPGQGESKSSTVLISLTSTPTVPTKLSQNLVRVSLSTLLSTTRLTTRKARRMVG